MIFNKFTELCRLPQPVLEHYLQNTPSKKKKKKTLPQAHLQALTIVPNPRQSLISFMWL